MTHELHIFGFSPSKIDSSSAATEREFLFRLQFSFAETDTHYGAAVIRNFLQQGLVNNDTTFYLRQSREVQLTDKRSNILPFWRLGLNQLTL